MFLEDILEANGIAMMKWKHLCKEKGVSTMKGKIPRWFKELELKILEDMNGDVRKIKKEFIERMAKRVHLIFDGEELNMNHSPNLIKCEGCDQNISKKDYNERIEIIDNLIKSDEEFITLIKNSIFENDSFNNSNWDSTVKDFSFNF
ncbi:hypothetical protein C1646_759612 [Rhizophagus diaphanus]|nr:hypothetical protein C1646_759612 [Rhizophagus diaphanus] [Rhizophagus sp. MUCL 43196]